MFSFPLGLFPFDSPMDPLRAQQVEAMFGTKMMGSKSFWSAIMKATDAQFDRLVGRAARIEAMFGDRMMGSDSFWSAIMNSTEAQFDRLVRRAAVIEAMFGNTALG